MWDDTSLIVQTISDFVDRHTTPAATPLASAHERADAQPSAV
jgi:hypothetical protein